MNGTEQLFRKQAVTGSADQAFGRVTAVIPPSGFVGAYLSIVCVGVIVAVAFFVRMPLKIEAAGVLMPRGGLVDIIAVADGRVDRIHGRAMARIGLGESLFDISVHSAVVDGVASSHFRFQSIQREMDQLRRIRAARDLVFEDQLGGLRQQLDAVDGRRQFLERQLAAQKELLAAAEVRVDRHLSLARDGHVAKDVLDQERESLLRDRSALSGIEQQKAGLHVERQALLTRIAALRRERDVSRAEFELRVEQLSRDIESSASQSNYSVRSPQDGVIESLLVEPGAFVRKGQVLARLSRGQRLLEAWLYLPSSSARMLAAGQRVELRLDAWPGSAFGSRTATVYFVSSIPLSPTEVSAPLAVAVPVFEIRARLDRQPPARANGQWTIPPGTTFRAFVLQREMRLYEWLFRNRLDQSTDRHA